MTDETAYQRYLDGDAEAMTYLVEKYGDAIAGYIHRYIGDWHESEDLMIEAFVRLLAKKRTITGDGGFQAYLYRIARNLALRHRAGQAPVSLDELPAELCGEFGADRVLLREERESMLHGAMAKLKRTYREALYLVYFENMSYREAGQVLHKTEGQITNLVHRGKMRLRAILEEEGFVYYDSDADGD